MVYGSHSDNFLKKHCDFGLKLGGNGNGPEKVNGYGVSLRISSIPPKREGELGRN